MLFTFPSRYLFTIGRQLVFSLTAWSPQLHAKFHVHRITQEIPRASPVFGYRPFTFCGATFHPLHLTFEVPRRAPTTPPASWWFGLFRFRSPLLTESNSLSLPPVTEMFHFTGCCLATLCIQVAIIEYYLKGVIPFGNPRVKACLPLTVAYRSLPRPSSPLGTKAFMIRP